jgi:hypothetical protein
MVIAGSPGEVARWQIRKVTAGPRRAEMFWADPTALSTRMN